MPNIIKGFNCLFFVIFYSQISFGQVLMDTGGDLNLSSGSIYDVEYLDVIEKYVLVGDFQLVNGSETYKNIVILNKDLSIYSSPFLANLNPDGPITGAGAFRFFIFGQYNTSIYLGGEFTTLNGSARNGGAVITIIDNGTSIIIGPQMNSWNPDFNWPKVFDVDIWSSRAVYTGGFSDIFVSTTPTLSNQIALFYANNGNHYTTIDNYNSYSNEYAWNIEVIGGYIYLAADQDEFLKISPLGTLAQGGPQFIDNSVLISDLDDSLIAVGYNHPSGGGFGSTNIAVLRKSDLTEKTDHAYSIFNPSAGTLFSFDTYNELLFATNNNSIKRYELDDINLGSGISPAQSFPLGSSGSLNHNDIVNPNSGFVDNMKSNVIIKNNYMFVSFSNMTTASSQPRTRLAAYCLPPKDPTNFISPDTLICQGDTVSYSLPVAEYADGYDWVFSGAGVDVDTSSSTGQTLFSSTGTPNVVLAIWEDFTPGILTVTPYSTCGNGTVGNAKVYGNSISINIDLNPLPNAVAGNDTVITCNFGQQVTLNGYSDSVIVSSSWNQILNPLALDSVGLSYAANDSDWYVFKVEAPNGCLNFDTVFVDMDTIHPNFDPIVPGTLGCGDTIYVSGAANNGVDTVAWWQPEGQSTQFPNPLECSVSGYYNFYTQFTGNGCVDSVNIFIDQNQDPPIIEIIGYPVLPSGGGILDYFTCDNPSLTLELTSPTPGAVLNWVDENGLNPSGTIANADSVAMYYVDAYNPSNNCVNSLSLTIAADTTKPSISIDPISSLNCSNDSLQLNGSTINMNTTLTWTGGTISPSSNPVYVFDPGYYTLSVEVDSNGCTSVDSIQVIQDNSIDVLTSSDTVGCDQDPINVSASYVGTITGITYLWSNGSTSSTATYTAGTDNMAIVEINGDGGCYGTDTVFIGIPPIPAIAIDSYAPCGNPNSGYLIINPISGWAPFEYSLDGGSTYQTSPTLSGLGVGTYTITVKDSLGCTFDFPAELTDNAAPPTPDFLLSTYNFESDTLAIVDVSNPAPDSVNWIFPPSFIVIDDNDTLPLVILPDTGAFDVTMEAYYGSCIGTKTKTIYVTETDTTLATAYNNNGIKSVDLYPNPTSGTFTVEIELYKKQSVSLLITDMSGVVIGSLYDYQDVDLITEQIEMIAAAGNGTYVLRVAAEFDSAYITFVLNR